MGVVMVGESVEVHGRYKPKSRELVLREINEADDVMEPVTLGDCPDRKGGSCDDTPLLVKMRRALDLQPQGAEAFQPGHHDVPMIYIGLDLGGN
jgi:hypothetical protein